jgi:hypothetical protein
MPLPSRMTEPPLHPSLIESEARPFLEYCVPDTTTPVRAVTSAATDTASLRPKSQLFLKIPELLLYIRCPRV